MFEPVTGPFEDVSVRSDDQAAASRHFADSREIKLREASIPLPSTSYRYFACTPVAMVEQCSCCCCTTADNLAEGDSPHRLEPQPTQDQIYNVHQIA